MPVDRIEIVRRDLAERLPDLLTEHDVPGVSIAVLADGRTAEIAAGVVNRRTDVAVTTDSVFMIQSITKVWTATLVMQLVDDGLLALDDLVRTHLPAFRTADEAAGAEITVRHLLTHTGGFEGDLWAPTTDGDDALERFVADLVSAAPQHSAPGRRFSYCNAGYGVLARLVEVHRDLPYEAALRRHLAEPLGVSEIAFDADEALAFRTAIGHGERTPGAAVAPLDRWAVFPPSNPAAGNQLAMSARSLLAFARMHLADGLAADGTRVLSRDSARAMRERSFDHPVTVGPPGGQGLGWRHANRPGVLEHSGGAPGVAALLEIVPGAGVAVAMLTNSDNSMPVIRAVFDLVLAELAGIEPTPTPTDHGTVVDHPQRYVGRYASRQYAHEVATEDGRLWLTTADQNEGLSIALRAGLSPRPERRELRRLDDDRMVLLDDAGAVAGAVRFDVDDPGPASALYFGNRVAPRVA